MRTVIKNSEVVVRPKDINSKGGVSREALHDLVESITQQFAHMSIECLEKDNILPKIIRVKMTVAFEGREAK